MWKDAPSLFADVGSLLGVELSWTQLERWHPTYLLHTAADRVPVMWVKTNGRIRFSPTQIRCHAFEGTIRTEWPDGKPSLFGLAFHGFLASFGIPYPYREYETLRSENGNGVIAACSVSYAASFQDWRATVVAQDNAYQIRHEHLPSRKGVFYNGDRVSVSNEDGEVITAVVDYTRPERGRIIVPRAAPGIEAVLAFVLLKARELETDDSD
jgi:hypothetical protein